MQMVVLISSVSHENRLKVKISVISEVFTLRTEMSTVMRKSLVIFFLGLLDFFFSLKCQLKP